MRIYVGNVSKEINEQILRDAFLAYGHVREITIVRRQDSNQGKDFAFIEMPADGEGLAAISALNGQELENRRLFVNRATPKLDYDAHSPSRIRGLSKSSSGFGRRDTPGQNNRFTKKTRTHSGRKSSR